MSSNNGPEWLRKLNVPLEHIQSSPLNATLGIPQVEFIQGVPTFVNPVVVAEKVTTLPVHDTDRKPDFGYVDPELFAHKHNKKVETDRLLAEDEIPAMPADYKPLVVGMPLLAIVPTKLPEKQVIAPKNPAATGEARYAAVVAEIGQANPGEAATIARLRLHESQHVGLITTPEQAIEHIIKCREDNTLIGGKDALTPKEIGDIKHQAYIQRRYEPHNRKREAVDQARAVWKKAIADRIRAIAQWDDYVKAMHDQFTITSQMNIDLFKDPDKVYSK